MALDPVGMRFAATPGATPGYPGCSIEMGTFKNRDLGP